MTIRGVAGDITTGFYLNDTPLPVPLDPRGKLPGRPRWLTGTPRTLGLEVRGNF